MPLATVEVVRAAEAFQAEKARGRADGARRANTAQVSSEHGARELGRTRPLLSACLNIFAAIFIGGILSALLRERGVSDDAITQMTVANPRTIFGQTEPY